VVVGWCCLGGGLGGLGCVWLFVWGWVCGGGGVCCGGVWGGGGGVFVGGVGLGGGVGSVWVFCVGGCGVWGFWGGGGGGVTEVRDRQLARISGIRTYEEESRGKACAGDEKAEGNKNEIGNGTIRRTLRKSYGRETYSRRKTEKVSAVRKSKLQEW